MSHTRLRLQLPLTTLAAACFIAVSPLAATAGQDAQKSVQAAPGKGGVVVEQVENGPVFGAEFKYARVNHEDEFLLGGYAGVVFDNTLLIGGAGYWQVDSGHYGYDDYYYGYDDYYDYHGVNGYGGLLLEWYALRTSGVALSARGLIGGGVATVGWPVYADVHEPAGRHGSAYPPAGGYYAYGYDQGYFIFEPQLNLTVRIAPGVAMVGGVGYRVIGAANGFEDQIQGLTGTFAIRFGGGK
jgi:hypothetical protein